MPVTDAVRRVKIETTSTGADKATADLNKLATAQKGVAVASDQTTKATLSLDAALERSRRGLDLEYRATARARQETNLWNQALSRGDIALAEHSMRLTQIAAKYDLVGVAASRASRFAGMGGALAGGFGLGVGTGALLGLPMLINSARDAVSSLDDLGDAAQRAGVSGEKLQVLRYAMEQTTGTAEGADAGLQRLNKTIGDAVLGNSAAAKAFDQLGVEVKDSFGVVKDTGTVLDDVAAKLRLMGSDAEASSVASRLFGREIGPAIAAAAREGANGLDGYGDKLKEIGMFSDDTLARSDALDKKLKDVAQSWSYLWKTVVTGGTAEVRVHVEGLGLATKSEAAYAASKSGQIEDARGRLEQVDKNIALGSSGSAEFDAKLKATRELLAAKVRNLQEQRFASTRDQPIGGSAAAAYIGPGMGGAGAPASGAHGPGWTSGADIYNEKVAAAAEAQKRLTKDTQDYVPVRQQATAADDAATAAQDRYRDALGASAAKTDEMAGSIKSLIDTAVHGGNVLQALGEQLLDFGSDQLSKSLAGMLQPILAPVPAAPMNLAAAPVGGAPWASWLRGVNSPRSAMGGGVGSDYAASTGGWGAAIASSASKFGIDPHVMTQVGKSEALGSSWQSQVITKAGNRETSFGPFQLLTGGGLGDKFQKQTGLDLSNPAAFNNPVAMQQYTDFVGQQASMGGWGPWHGAQRVGIGNWEGIGGASPAADISKNLAAVADVTKQAATGFSKTFPQALQGVVQAVPGSMGSGGGGGAFGWLGGLLGGGADEFGLSSGDWSGITSGILSMHGGGTVGVGGGTRSAPMSLFLNAPPYHSGLAPDERPAILQVGEEVRSRAQVARDRSSGNVFHYSPTNYIDARNSTMSREEFSSLIEQNNRGQQEEFKRNFASYRNSSHLLKE